MKSTTLKKVIAVGAGAVMLGATMFSALAQADLSNYPAPFVKDGKFDAFIVVGQNAAAEDVVGAVDIGASLQFEMRKETSLGLGDNVIISDGVKIKGTGSQVFNYGEYYGGVRSAVFDEEDLPQLLAEGRYVENEGATDNDENYVQELQLSTTSGYGTYDQPEDDLNGDTYLELFDNEPAYTYSVTFDNSVDYALSGTGSMQDDIEGTQIILQGNLYTITNAKFYSDDSIEELELMAGDTLVWLMQDNIIEKTVNGVTHEIKVVDVTDSEDSCGVSVDGYVAWIDTRSDKTINGLNIGVLDAKAVHAQLQDVDICQLNLGATEIKLPDGDNVIRDGEEIEDAEVTINSDGTSGEWYGFSVEYTPNDDVYMSAGQELIDPSFGNFKIMMGELTANYEVVKVKNSGSKKGTVTFQNNDGKEVEVPYFYEDGTGGWGKKEAEQMLFEGQSCDGTFDGTDVEDCEGTTLYVINSGGTAHVLELTGIDLDDRTIDLKDQTYGRTWSDVDADEEISMGSLGKITLTMADPLITATETDSNGNEAETKNAGTITITASTATPIPDDTYLTLLTFTENKDFPGQTITIEGKWDSSDEDIELHLNTAGTTYIASGVEKTSDVDYPEVYATEYGTLVEVDEEDQIQIFHPSDQAEINAFIAPVSAEIMTEGWNTLSIDKINVGAARLDTEIGDYTKDNLILVGGPCANIVAAQVMGVASYEPGCYAGLESGEAIIKLYEQTNGKVSMIVAGMDALDTRRATRVISNFEAYHLTGKEAKVTGTSLTDIKVSIPS